MRRFRMDRSIHGNCQASHDGSRVSVRIAGSLSARRPDCDAHAPIAPGARARPVCLGASVLPPTRALAVRFALVDTWTRLIWAVVHNINGQQRHSRAIMRREIDVEALVSSLRLLCPRETLLQF